MKECIGKINDCSNELHDKCKECVKCIIETNLTGPCECCFKYLCRVKKQEDLILEGLNKKDCKFYNFFVTSKNWR